MLQKSRHLFIAAACFSVLAGLANVSLISQINHAINTPWGPSFLALAWPFAGTAVLILLLQSASHILFERLGQNAEAHLKHYICSKVMLTDYRRLETLGGPRIQSALTEHCEKVKRFFVVMPQAMVNAMTVLGCLAYLSWLSWQVFLLAVLVIGLGMLGYHLVHLRAIRHINLAAQAQDGLHGMFRALVDGAKELRLNRARAGHFEQKQLHPAIEVVRRERIFGMSIFYLSTFWGSFLIFGFIGLVLFALIGDVPDRGKVVTGFALVFVYMMTPLEALLIVLPEFNLAKVSSRHIDEISGELQAAEEQALPVGGQVFTSLALRQVCHRYYNEAAGDMFAMGPINLQLNAGELVYLVGGNGSGKTTLAKLLTGLYRAESGEIILNGHAVNADQLGAYRQLFGAVFSDFHLFDTLLTGQDVDAAGNALLVRLQLQHKVTVKEGAFTTQALSQGQRKRLALVATYLEDRPIYVFDEWAADQDPTFKDVFYRELLPELKARGKTVLVITHDDRYFDLADRVIHLEQGQIVGEKRAYRAEDQLSLV
nr:cyclic peptide export ABC transporter [Chitinivorax tropicus]